jgi:hypothetical protein
MSKQNEAVIAYFVSITHCNREEAIDLLAKHQWKLDQSLNQFFEQDCHRQRSISNDLSVSQQ